MGINRYYSSPIPITNIFDLIFLIILISIIFKQLNENQLLTNTLNPYMFITFIWMLYCIINLFNNTTGEIHFTEWLKTFRPLGLYPFITCIIISIGCKHYSVINKFLLLLGVLTILASIKGIYQYKCGFDNTEWTWLQAVGAKTHIISSGIRYFSFFTDAANFGCSMGFSAIIFFISFIFTKEKRLKWFYSAVFILATIGLFLSGTRAALAVPFVGLALFIILSKKWKLFILGTFTILSLFLILRFTTIGNSSQFIRRMRTAFNIEDASFQVRLHNQEALRKYMSEAPFGIGIGIMNNDLPTNNKFYFVSVCAPDSDLVNIWVHLGIIGLIVYLILQFFIYTIGSIYLLFKIQNPEIRGPLTAMFCGCAGLLVASYGNMINFQFPNGILTYSCLTLVFLGTYFDKQYSIDHGQL